MKILLINPPVFNDIGSHRSESPPLSLLYLAGYLEKNGYTNIKVIDPDIEEMSWHQLGELLTLENPDVIGVGGVSFSLPALVKTAEIAKKRLPNVLVIAGGFGPTNDPEKVLRTGVVDLVVMGEGEETLLEIVQGQDHKKIAGVAYLEDKVVYTQPRKYTKDINSLWPAYHLLTSDFSKYPGQPLNKQHSELKKPIITVLASRGCPHRCTFCSLGSKVYRPRKPKDVVDEMEYYKNKFGVKSVALYDDEFIGMSPGQNKWVIEICDEIIKRKLNLKFLTQGRCSQFVELETLKKMKEAGFVWIWWGVESGSQRILDEVIHKDIKIEDVYKVFSLAKQAGIKSLMFIMVGFPKETPKDIKMSSDLIKKIKPESVGLHITTPNPGSELMRYLKEHNLLENKLENLEDYYLLDTRHTNFHTNEMTAEEIQKYHKMLVFQFNHNYWYFIGFGLKSLMTVDGWKKLFKRIKIVIGYCFDWLRIKFS